MKIADLVGEQFFGHDIELFPRVFLVDQQAGERLGLVEGDVAVSHAGISPEEVALAETKPDYVVAGRGAFEDAARREVRQFGVGQIGLGV